MKLNIERISSAYTYFIAISPAWLANITSQDVAFIVSFSVGIGTFLVNWYYRRKSYQLLAKSHLNKNTFKRCSAAAMLSLVTMLPSYFSLHVSEKELHLSAGSERCKRESYQCNACVWTRGFAHTADKKPTLSIKFEFEDKN